MLGEWQCWWNDERIVKLPAPEVHMFEGLALKPSERYGYLLTVKQDVGHPQRKRYTTAELNAEIDRVEEGMAKELAAALAEEGP